MARTRKAKPSTIPPQFTDASRGIRLQKVLAEAGVASRRQCEALITDGCVTVNGQPITAMPAWVDPDNDRIEVDGRLVKSRIRPGTRRRHIYVIVHKPRRVICTTSDPQGRRTVVDLVDLPRPTTTRLYPVGRLDADSSGLILLTNDGELANRLTHPRYGIEKQYLVSIKGKLTNEDVQRLKSGLYLAPPASPKTRTKKATMAQVKIVGFRRDKVRGDRTNVLVVLTEGQNREIRRLLARLDFNVRRLQRVAIGPLKLKGLAIGQWRMLTTNEVRAVHRAAGLTSS